MFFITLYLGWALLAPTDFEYTDEYITDGFDYPVGKPDADGYYNAQPFGENNHLGDDFNALTGGDTDLGDPVYTVANGYVRFAQDVGGGWGNVIRVVHKMPDGTWVESLYGHCDTMLVKTRDWVKRGDQIGTIGNAHGQYKAHLHFEMRNNLLLRIGPGYAKNKDGYLNPVDFIDKNRPANP